MIDIEKIRALCEDETIILTHHLSNRARERGIKYKEIKTAILNGEIIERYENDYPYPSCLILGLAADTKPLHIVIGISDDKLWIITVYCPSLDKWEIDYKTRKAVE